MKRIIVSLSLFSLMAPSLIQSAGVMHRAHERLEPVGRQVHSYWPWYLGATAVAVGCAWASGGHKLKLKDLQKDYNDEARLKLQPLKKLIETNQLIPNMGQFAAGQLTLLGGELASNDLFDLVYAYNDVAHKELSEGKFRNQEALTKAKHEVIALINKYLEPLEQRHKEIENAKWWAKLWSDGMLGSLGLMMLSVLPTPSSYGCHTCGFKHTYDSSLKN